MDDKHSYMTQIAEMENDPVFKKFLEDNKLSNQRASLIVFAPESFMYWYGIATSEDIQDIPKELMKYELPAAEVAEIEFENYNMTFFSQPLNFVVPTFMEQLSKNNVMVHENPGDSQNPYLLSKLDLQTKKLDQILYLDPSIQKD